ncbi:MAG: hypothetical protein WCY11_08525 [Novosphingobium sp.]
MDIDDQMHRFFGMADLATLSPAGLAAGVERMAVEFGMEQDRGRRFALWTLMHMFGAAPDLDVAFSEPADREAARDFMDLLDRVGDS